MNAEKLIESGYLQKAFESSNIKMNRQCEGSIWKYLEADRTFYLYEWVLFIMSRLNDNKATISIFPNDANIKKEIVFVLRDDQAKRKCLEDLFEEGLVFKKVVCIKYYLRDSFNGFWVFEIYLHQEENK